MLYKYKNLLLLLLTWTEFKDVSAFPHNHGQTGLHHRHHHANLKRDTVQCAFPHAEKMIAVTPEEGNAGWAMSPNQYCTSDSWCPYACEPGYLMAQWSPHATSYTYPESMHGGLYCNSNGSAVKPFENKDYCYPGSGNVFAVDESGNGVSFCQTVLPGNEAMLIPTWVSASSKQVLAVPDATYWDGTAAHYYINPPGVSTSEGCVWGSSDKPYGNWAPYVAGANMDQNNITYVKLGANPIYLDDPYWSTIKPTFGLKVECEGDTCSGLPCYMDPREKGVQGCPDGSPNGAGDACFCVVGFQPGTTARIVVVDYSDQLSSSSVFASSTATATTPSISTSATASSTLTSGSTSSSSIPTSDTQTTSQSSSSIFSTALRSTVKPNASIERGDYDKGSQSYLKGNDAFSSAGVLSDTGFVTVDAPSSGNGRTIDQNSGSVTSGSNSFVTNSIVAGTSSSKSIQSDARNSELSTSTNDPVVTKMTTSILEGSSSKDPNKEGKTVSGSEMSTNSAESNIFLTTVTSYSNSASPVVHTVNGQETTSTTTVVVPHMHAEIQTVFDITVAPNVAHETAFATVFETATQYA
ncbi:beta-glucosidase Adg3 [Schizosaccharomyces cryophilus OY26]|uniref:Beta-glucosidase Adg3 n=1 Tax=Schizosaccharomyces cryophilus (strain OY26 / ATCC MYA-4695 / CBS 11777 / NBRC 106824 / NRRL Y48691) TaxID=653667 RepID=S9X2A5_SCHCR|nr:beta-glucosidase Adg3 [Schizosaccharomyces cryophilus OY26]EPY51237.1 beta-glucosidase Adg3 [Schizosaccharomyces cryophilus OY26]